jgi:hypothetical protein
MADIKVALELDNKQYIAGLRQSETAATGFATSTSTSLAGVGTAFAGIAASIAPLVAAFAGLGAILATISFADELDDLSRATDVSVGKILQLQGALATSGGSAEDAAVMIGKLQREIQAARLGSADAQNSLAKLGFTLADMARLTPEQGIQKTIDALALMPDATERNALAFQLLGRSAASIDWEGVAAGLDGSTEKYDKFTYATELAGQVSDTLAATYKTLKLALLEALIPVMELGLQLARLPGVSKLASAAGFVLVETFRAVALLASDVAFVIDRMVSGVVALTQAGGEAARGNFANAKTIIAAYNTESAALRANLDKWQQSVSTAATQQEKIDAAARKSDERRRANQQSATGAPAVAIANQAQIEAIRGLADTYALLNQKTRDKIQLDFALIGATQENIRVQAEQLRINQAAADAIDKLETQRRQLKDTMTDNAARSAIDQTIAKIRSQAVADTEATTQIIRNQEDVIRVRERSVAAYKSLQQFQTTAFEMIARQDISNPLMPLNDRIEKEQKLNAIIQIRNRYLEGAATLGLKPNEVERLRLRITDATSDSRLLNVSFNDLGQTIGNTIQTSVGLDSIIDDATLKRLNEFGLGIQYVGKNAGVLSDTAKELAKMNEYIQFGVYLNEKTREQRLAIMDIDNQIADLTMSDTAKRLSAVDRLIAREAELQVQRMETARGSLLTESERARISAALTKIYEKQSASNAYLISQSREFSTGWKKAMADYVDSVGNAAERAGNLFKKATQGMEDAIVNFVKTGKFEWRDFVNSMLEELLRSQIRQIFARTMTDMTNMIPGTAGAGGGGGGGSNILGDIWDFGKSLLGFANGGVVPTNGPVIVGERGPELLYGAAGMTVDPRIGGGGTVNYYINAVDAPSFRALIARDPSFIHAVSEQGRRSVPGTRR